MITLYKLTDGDGQTRGGTQWGPGVSHSGTGEGELCGPGWIHAYEHPLIAVLMNPIHARFKNPRLWEAEGEVGLRDGQLKCGCKTLTTIREIPLPAITTEMRVRFAILCAKEVCACLSWNAWADKWLSGGDRSEAAAGAAAAGAAAEAAYRSARAAEAAASAAYAAAASAAYAAEDAAEDAASAAREVGHGIDIFAIAENACSGVRTFEES
jgi:pyruvate/2-oxoglutarate dehydrogenase complex dihydrolipoamide acyltransferase (E2) component